MSSLSPQLLVGDPGGSRAAYLEMVHPEIDAERKTRLADALRVYCRRGMVRIAQHFLATTEDAHLSEQPAGPSSMPATRKTIFPILTHRFTEAFAFASVVHSAQERKGTQIPYLSHLMAVASLVLEHGGDEDMAIAALLHDAPEDQGGYPMLDQVRARFGEEVAKIVEACTDTFEDPKPAYRERKERYIKHLYVADTDACVVAAADKLHNARAILADYRVDGDKLWARFNADRETLHWYYKGVADALDASLAGHRAHAMVDELRNIVVKVWEQEERLERSSL